MKRLKKMLLVLICTTLISIPCYVHAEEEETEPTPSPSETPIETPEEIIITLDQQTLSLKVGESATLISTVTPEDTTVAWSSSDDDIVTVENGKVIAQKIGTATITVKAGEKEATCIVTVEEEKQETASTVATLKRLRISNGTLNETFQSDVFKYTVTINSTDSALEFTDLKSDLSDSNAGYKVAGNNNLKNGSTVKIVVTAEDGKTNETYTLTIVKDATSLNLKSLKINGYALNESFDASKLEYTASIPYEIDTITVAAAAQDSAANVKVTGLTNLKVGNNTVTITVSDNSGNSRKYQIIVTRETKVSVEENPTSIITSSNNTQTSSNGIIIPSTSDDDSILKYIIVSIACFILFAIGGIGIYFYLKTSPRKLKRQFKSLKEKENTSPIVEVENQSKHTNNESVSKAMQEDLVQTREFHADEFKKHLEVEDLFDNDKDV